MKRTHTRSRILAMLLTLAMCLSLLPGAALAAELPGVLTPGSLFIEIEQGQADTTADFVINLQTELPETIGGASFVDGNLAIASNSNEAVVGSVRANVQSPKTIGVTFELSAKEICHASGTYDYNFQVFFKANLAEYVTGKVEEVTLTLPVRLVIKDRPQSRLCEIWFNPNGGTAIKPQGYEYFDRDWYGTTIEALTDDTGRLPVLPTASREGYTFDGWYTAETGGVKVSERTDLSDFQGNANGFVSGQVCLWAHWTQDKSEDQPQSRLCEIWFNPNGGTAVKPQGYEYFDVNWQGTTIEALTDDTGRLPVLPTASRDGYTFDGWYTAETGGVKVSERTDLSDFQGNANGFVSGQVCLWAHWTQAPASTYINFFPNGGVIADICGHKPSEFTGGSYQELWDAGFGYELSAKFAMLRTQADGTLPGFPTVTRNGYVFDGWYQISRSDIPDAAWGQVDVSPEFMTEKDFSGLKKTTYSPQTTYTAETCYAAKWTQSKGSFTVSYDWNGATFLNAIEPQTVASGDSVPLYIIKDDFGHTLKGWATEDGVLWDNRTMKATKDMTLYAAWDPAFGDDDFNFNNGYDYFDSYNVSDQYLRYLVRNESNSRKNYIRDFANKDSWGGSCFGMSAVYAMQKGKALDVSVFQSGAKTLWDLEAPKQSNNIRDLVNYYMLSQLTTPANNAKNAYYDVKDLSTRYSNILSGIQNSGGYALLGFNSARGGHAVIAKSVSGGKIAIWDPNYPGVDITLTVSGSKAKFSGPSGLSEEIADYNTNTELKYVMPFNTRSQSYDASNLQSVFKKSPNAASSAAQSGRAILTSTVGDFTVAAGGKTATVKNGAPSGDLALTRIYIDGAEDSAYRYELDAADAKSLTLTFASADAVVQVVTDGVYTRVEAPKLKTVAVSEESVTTNAAASGRQSITLVSGKLDKNWNKVTVTGSDTGFQVGAAAGQVTVASDNGVTATVTGENSDTWEAGKPQTVIAAPQGTVLTTAQLSGGGTGSQPAAPTSFPFSDVEENRWFRPFVQAAYEAGLVKGLTDTTYGPGNTLTLAEAVTFAARIYAEAHNEAVPTGGTPWYQAAYNYCVEKGVIDAKTFALEDMTRTATRFEMVAVLDGAVPEARMDNSVAVKAIPDLAESDDYGEPVYRWYRAGILSGDASGAFNGQDSITRAEVAKILCTIHRLG